MTRALTLRSSAVLPIVVLVALAAAPAAANAVAIDESTRQRVDAVFAAWSRPDSPGAAISILRDGELLYEHGYGSAQLEYQIPIGPQTPFQVASVTKQFTCMAIELLARDGKLSWDDEVRRHLPELPDFGVPITLRQLANHTSGLRDQWELLALAGWRLDDVITREHILKIVARQRELNFAPGTEYLYSNTGYTLLAEVVARVSGKTFREFADERIFAPLGMTRTHVHDDHEELVPGRAYSYAPRDGGFRASREAGATDPPRALALDAWFFARVTVVRGAAGGVSGIRVGGGRVRSLRFDRR